MRRVPKVEDFTRVATSNCISLIWTLHLSEQNVCGTWTNEIRITLDSQYVEEQNASPAPGSIHIRYRCPFINRNFTVSSSVWVTTAKSRYLETTAVRYNHVLTPSTCHTSWAAWYGGSQSGSYSRVQKTAYDKGYRQGSSKYETWFGCQSQPLESWTLSGERTETSKRSRAP